MKNLWAVGVREYAPNSFRIRVERLPEDKENKFDMPGTEGTHGYTVHATVEADEKKIARMLTRTVGWRQPGDSEQDRFSTTAFGGKERDMALGIALKAAGFVKAEDRKINPDTEKVAGKLGVNANGRTARAVITNRLVRLASTKVRRNKAMAAASA